MPKTTRSSCGAASQSSRTSWTRAQTLEVLFGRTKLSADEIAVNTDAGLLDPTAREGEYRAEAERLLGEALQHAELKSRE